MATEKEYRLVCTDNFNRDYIPEKWCGDTLYGSEESAKHDAKLINGASGDYSAWYIKVVELPYKLYEVEY